MTAPHRISVFGRQGNEISVIVAGSGPPLMLVHGFPLDHRLWLPQIESLAADFQVLAPEMRGFGRTTLGPETFSLADLADDCELVRQHFARDRRIVLCGLSMGGYVAFEYWSKYRDRLCGLGLASTKPDEDTSEARAARLEMETVVKEQGTAAVVEPMLSKLLSPHTMANQPQVVELVRAMMHVVPPATIAAAQRAMAERRSFTAQLSEIDCPTLVWTGSDDPLAPPDRTRIWAARLPRASCEIIDRAGHLSPLETPSPINRLLHHFTAACHA
ncbi:MAG: alpha/beta hydrolase [Pirellulaceae bacterium]|nr:MAG: alpha/beta hydrolase [Pirellulaceae bacterium]